MNEEAIKQKIYKLLKKIAPDTEPETLKPDENIRQGLEIDSFDYLQFIVSVDEAFGFETPEEDYGKIESVNNLVSYISNKQKGAE